MTTLTIQPAEGLYTRTMHGTRPRYTLAYSHVNDYHLVDVMKAGEFGHAPAYGEGGTRDHFDVTPVTAACVAAASIAEQAMVQAMLDASKVQPAQPLEKYTIKQLEAIRKARDIMQEAGCFVSHWQYAGVHDIVRAGIAAVKNHKPS